MFNQLTLDEFLKLSREEKRIVVFQEFSSDILTPIGVYQALTNRGDGSALLESGIKDKDVGNYSFIATSPILTFRSKGNDIELSTPNNTLKFVGNPLERLRKLLQERKCREEKSLPLAGGAIGYLTYDAIRLFEKIPNRHEDKDNLPDLFFQFYEVMIAFDHFKGIVTFSVLVEISDKPEDDYKCALRKIDALKKRCEAAKLTPSKSENSSFEKKSLNDLATADIDDEAFMQKAILAKDYIVKGDAFQIVLSRCFKRPYSATPLDIYRALRHVTPAPFMFFIETQDYAIAGASPERLVSLKDGMLEVTPIAGSRPRVDPETDALLEKELLSDEKEDAEHMMLVDLGRNDLGRVSVAGSVEVKVLKALRRFSHIMHLVSRVEGKLKDGLDGLSVLKATFPAGTLTGAPKIRAMQIIDELETSRRGVYGGAICTIDASGNLDSCIAIRTAFLKDGVATVRAGAGIVFDSDPKKEAEETRTKVKGVLEAISMAEEGI